MQITESPTQLVSSTPRNAEHAATLAQEIVTASKRADEAMKLLAELLQRRRALAAELGDATGNPNITQRFGGYFGPTGALHHHGVDRFADIVRVAAAARAPLTAADRQFLAAYLSPSEAKE